MAKVAVIYVAATKHVLACFTTAGGSFDSNAKVTDFVDKYVPVRVPGSAAETIFFPSKSDAIKLTVVDVASRTVLAAVLSGPLGFSVVEPSKDQKDPDLVQNEDETPARDTTVSNALGFTLGAAPNKALACIAAVQKDTPPSADNLAIVTPTEAMDPSSKKKTIAIDPGSHHFLLFVENRMPLIA